MRRIMIEGEVLVSEVDRVVRTKALFGVENV